MGLPQPLRRVWPGRTVCQHRPRHTVPVHAGQAEVAGDDTTGGAQLARTRAPFGRGRVCFPVPTTVLARHGSRAGCLRRRWETGLGLPLHLAHSLHLPELLRGRAVAGVAAHPVVRGAHQSHRMAILVHQLGLA